MSSINRSGKIMPKAIFRERSEGRKIKDEDIKEIRELDICIKRKTQS